VFSTCAISLFLFVLLSYGNEVNLVLVTSNNNIIIIVIVTAFSSIYNHFVLGSSTTAY